MLAAPALLLTSTPAAAAADPFAAVTITGDVGAKPTVAVSKPVSVKTSSSEVVNQGSGDPAAKGATVTLDYVFLNGRTGEELESSYGSTPVSLRLDKTTKAVIAKNLIGAKVGSRVAIAIAPNEGMAKALTSDKIKQSDTLIFVADIKDAHTALKRATGDAVAPVDGLPTVKLAKSGKPTITMPKADAPTALVAQPLIKGTGPAVTSGQTLRVNYTGAIWRNGKVFDSSWKTGQAADFPIGNGSVIKGWDDGLVGQTVGSQVLLVIPPDEGYGTAGSPSVGIKGTDTLVFVVDILDAT